MSCVFADDFLSSVLNASEVLRSNEKMGDVLSPTEKSSTAIRDQMIEIFL